MSIQVETNRTRRLNRGKTSRLVVMSRRLVLTFWPKIHLCFCWASHLFFDPKSVYFYKLKKKFFFLDLFSGKISCDPIKRDKWNVKLYKEEDVLNVVSQIHLCFCWASHLFFDPKPVYFYKLKNFFWSFFFVWEKRVKKKLI